MFFTDSESPARGIRESVRILGSKEHWAHCCNNNNNKKEKEEKNIKEKKLIDVLLHYGWLFRVLLLVMFYINDATLSI